VTVKKRQPKTDLADAIISAFKTSPATTSKVHCAGKADADF